MPTKYELPFLEKGIHQALPEDVLKVDADYQLIFAPRPTKTVKITENVTTSSTSFVDVTGMSFALPANTSYIFQFYAIFQSSATTRGIGFAINGPAGAVGGVQTRIPTSLTALTDGVARGYDSGTATSGIDTADASTLAIIQGIAVNGANAGTLQLRFKAETAGEVRVMAGSSGLLYTVS
jgi:hypothetical protein